MRSNLFGMLIFNFFNISFIERLKILSNPDNPISSETRAFCKDSLKFLPIAMASPTDFIDVPRIGLVSENFSNVNLGIFVTT